MDVFFLGQINEVKIDFLIKDVHGGVSGQLLPLLNSRHPCFTIHQEHPALCIFTSQTLAVYWQHQRHMGG